MAKKLEDLLNTMPAEQRHAAEELARQMMAELPLHELRRARHLSQTTLAKAMDLPQGNISRIEHQADTYVSTLRNYIKAMGGTLSIIAEFPDGSYKINQFEEIGDVVDEELLEA